MDMMFASYYSNWTVCCFVRRKAAASLCCKDSWVNSNPFWISWHREWKIPWRNPRPGWFWQVLVRLQIWSVRCWAVCLTSSTTQHLRLQRAQLLKFSVTIRGRWSVRRSGNTFPPKRRWRSWWSMWVNWTVSPTQLIFIVFLRHGL